MNNLDLWVGAIASMVLLCFWILSTFTNPLEKKSWEEHKKNHPNLRRKRDRNE